MQNIVLNNGVEIPITGFGTFQISEGQLCENCIYESIKTENRLFDTAASYKNEKSIGKSIDKAIQEKLVTRKDLFVATKVWVQDAGFEATKKALDLSLKRLGLDYIDLYLIHQPYGDYYGSWKAMEQMYKEGRAKSIGVCNFLGDRFVDLCLNSEIKPAINQIEIHPFLCRKNELILMKEYGVQAMAWGPLSEGQYNIFEHPILKKIANKHQKKIAQIVLRWHLQRGIITIPKTVHVDRMKENIDIFDFELSQKDMEMIEKLDIGHSEIIDYSSSCTAKWINKWKIHD